MKLRYTWRKALVVYEWDLDTGVLYDTMGRTVPGPLPTLRNFVFEHVSADYLNWIPEQ